MNEQEAIETILYASAFNREDSPLTQALDMAIEALEKRIAKKCFVNECNCIVDYDTLLKAIKKKCKSKNCYMHDKYRIVLRNNYPSICINRERYYVHSLIGEQKYGYVRKGYVIHHKDKNKLNAHEDNLELLTAKRHLKNHSKDRIGKDFRSAEGKKRSLDSAKEARTRKDVSIEKINELLESGLTFPEIARELNCGTNTVKRRIGLLKN